jgi:hypothetical protein
LREVQCEGKHKYHAGCLEQWLTKFAPGVPPTCPKCRDICPGVSAPPRPPTHTQ